MKRNKKIACYLLFILFLMPLFSIAEEAENLPALEKALNSKKDTAKVNLLNLLSWEYRRQDPGKALLYGVRAMELSKKLDYQTGLAFSLKNQGVIYWIKGEYALSNEKYLEAESLFRKEANKEEIGNIENLFGLLRWNQGKYPEAVIHYKNAVRYFEAIGDTEGKAYVYNNLGIIYYELGNTDEALDHYVAALKIYENLNDQFAMSNVYNNIGLIYSEQGNYIQALKHYRFSLRIDLESGNIAGQGKSYTNIGTLYYRLGELEKSEESHRKGMKIYDQIQDKKGISETLMNLAEIDLKRNDLTSAEEKLWKALEMKAAIGDEQGKSVVLLNLGKLRIKQKKYAQAVELLKESYIVAGRIGSLKYQAESALFLSEVYEDLDQKRDALLYYKSYVSINDSIQNQLTGNKLLNLQVAYETKKQEHQIEIWKKESIIEGNRKKALAGGIVLLGLLAIVLISRQRLKHKKEKKIAELLIETQCVKQRTLELEIRNMELELEFNHKSLMTYTQKLIEKNAMVEELKAQINESSMGEIPEGAESLRLLKINQLTDSKIVTEDDWTEFKKLYNAVYPEFMIRLREIYPAITQAELRLSALISLKLSSREIASILGISADSVKKSRQRLRKKMSLEIDEDLEQHIQAGLKSAHSVRD